MERVDCFRGLLGQKKGQFAFYEEIYLCNVQVELFFGYFFNFNIFIFSITVVCIVNVICFIYAKLLIIKILKLILKFAKFLNQKMNNHVHFFEKK